MRISNNEQVNNFLEELQTINIEKYNIVQKCRELVFDSYPNVKEKIIYGGIMFSLEEDFGGLFVSKNHVSFEFGKGYRMIDEDKLLEGIGKYRRHLKIKSLEDIQNKKVKYYVNQAV